jgi:hypothetical protein
MAPAPATAKRRSLQPARFTPSFHGAAPPGPGSGMTRLPSSEDAVPLCVPSNHAAIRPITA